MEHACTLGDAVDDEANKIQLVSLTPLCPKVAHALDELVETAHSTKGVQKVNEQVRSALLPLDRVDPLTLNLLDQCVHAIVDKSSFDIICSLIGRWVRVLSRTCLIL